MSACALQRRYVERERAQLAQQVSQLLVQPKIPKVWGPYRMARARHVEKRQPVFGLAGSSIGKDGKAFDMLSLEERNEALDQCRLVCAHL